MSKNMYYPKLTTVKFVALKIKRINMDLKIESYLFFLKAYKSSQIRKVLKYR